MVRDFLQRRHLEVLHQHVSAGLCGQREPHIAAYPAWRRRNHDRLPADSSPQATGFFTVNLAERRGNRLLVVCKEVIDRLCAEPGHAHYGRLSSMARYFCRAEKLFEVSPESVYPPPKVISAIVRLIPHPQPPVDAVPTILGKVVATDFSQRRKTLRNRLAASAR